MPHTMFSLLVAAVLLAPSTWPAEAQRCKLTGAVFGIDPLVSMMLIKDSEGYLKNVTLAPTTVFARLALTPGGPSAPMKAAEVDIGDLVCVPVGSPEPPAEISVMPRSDLHRAQRAFLAEWQRNGAYGTVSSLDVEGRTLLLSPLPPYMGREPVRVSLPVSARLRAARPEASLISDAVEFKLDELRPGEQVYIRGTRSDPGLTASLVMRGGYRAIVGSLVEVKVSDSVLVIHEYGTGKTLRMRMTPGQTYRTTENLTNPMKIQTEAGAVLVPVGLADLQTGDAILIVGKTDGENAGSGVIAVTKFGAFGVLPQDPGDRTSGLLAK